MMKIQMKKKKPLQLYHVLFYYSNRDSNLDLTLVQNNFCVPLKQFYMLKKTAT